MLKDNMESLEFLKTSEIEYDHSCLNIMMTKNRYRVSTLTRYQICSGLLHTVRLTAQFRKNNRVRLFKFVNLLHVKYKCIRQQAIAPQDLEKSKKDFGSEKEDKSQKIERLGFHFEFFLSRFHFFFFFLLAFDQMLNIGDFSS